MNPLRGLCVGAGYFARFHFEAWRRMEGVQIVAVCDSNEAKARQGAELASAEQTFADAVAALDAIRPDFVDIITPPPSHLELVTLAAERGVPIICQKPLAPTLAEAERIIAVAEAAGVPLMVHENFRFQPWHREVKRLLDTDTIGQLHTLTFRTRTGDGWGDDAYLARQPYFREMPRLLIHETGVHFLDTFRFLAGEVDEATAILRRMNPVIAGEDAALVTLRFASGAVGVWDANRFNETTDDNPRLTFGEFRLEGAGGAIRLDGAGNLFVHPLGGEEQPHTYDWNNEGFAGDCVFATQRHFVDRLRSGEPFETRGADYLRTLELVEAVYASSGVGGPVALSNDARRVVDLSRTINSELPGVDISVAKRLEVEGWNATTLSLYSHCGTHMDAPCHFLPGGAPLDQQDLAVCCGPARVVDLTPTEPAELITVERLTAVCSDVRRGDRLLLRTDWHRTYPNHEYRHALPRISVELAHWLVERGVAMVGVEPPSVADVNNKPELTEVHQVLFRGGVLIVEGLCNLDQLTSDTVEFVALPLKIEGGDGSPVRAIAIER